MKTFEVLMAGAAALGIATAATAETVTIATANNGDMIRMRGLLGKFTGQHPAGSRSSSSRRSPTAWRLHALLSIWSDGTEAVLRRYLHGG